MKRALLIVLDSVGCGAAGDAAQYGDAGANTLLHVLQAAPQVAIPTLRRLGWTRILEGDGSHHASCGVLTPQSAGKDTTTGHWELMGVVLKEPFATFEKFPDALLRAIEQRAEVEFLGNCAASGTAILEQLGARHLQTGQPILYTSADSVLQIAAHETAFGLERLYRVCHIAREIADEWRIGRVIARPFLGEPGNFKRTANRRDFSLVPPPTLLNRLQDRGVRTVGIGKIGDIFADSGLDESHPTKSNADGQRAIARLWEEQESGFYLANLVDFDTLYGHRRDPLGYARALEEFDEWLAGFVTRLGENDQLLITADHGNDPTFPGTDHTRENVPLIVVNGSNEWLGVREGFGEAAKLVDEFLND